LTWGEQTDDPRQRLGKVRHKPRAIADVADDATGEGFQPFDLAPHVASAVHAHSGSPGALHHARGQRCVDDGGEQPFHPARTDALAASK
jgi:hypothetical protein